MALTWHHFPHDQKLNYFTLFYPWPPPSRQGPPHESKPEGTILNNYCLNPNKQNSSINYSCEKPHLESHFLKQEKNVHSKGNMVSTVSLRRGLQELLVSSPFRIIKEGCVFFLVWAGSLLCEATITVHCGLRFPQSWWNRKWAPGNKRCGHLIADVGTERHETRPLHCSGIVVFLLMICSSSM